MRTLPFASALVFLISTSAGADEILLRRSTRAQLTECTVNVPESVALPRTQALIAKIVKRITDANPHVFQGDLAPEKLCFSPHFVPSQRAWAEADSRSFRVETGLIQRVQNEAQLAFVVAHELAHVAMRHTPLEGNPVPGPDGDATGELLMSQSEVFDRMIAAPKGSPEALRLMSIHQAQDRQLEDLFLRYFSPEFFANWMETEADVTGAMYYLKARYPAVELSWRVEQLVLGLQSAGLDPLTQQTGRGYDPHAPPSSHSSLERQSIARAACQVIDREPLRGLNRYPTPCWQIWHISVDLPSRYPHFKNLVEAADQTSLRSLELDEAKAEIAARPAREIVKP